RYSGGIWERSSSRSARPSERQAQRSTPETLERSTMIHPVPPHFSQTGCVDITSIMVQTHAEGGWVSWAGRNPPPVERAVRTRTGPVASIRRCQVGQTIGVRGLSWLAAGRMVTDDKRRSSVPLLTLAACLGDQRVGAVAGIVAERFDHQEVG